MSELNGMRVAFVVANEGIEQVELQRPWATLVEAGAHPELIAPAAGTAQMMNHLDKADVITVDALTAEADVANFDAVVLPGGVANPDQLRMDDAGVSFIKAMFEAGKPAAVICHGPWTLVEGDLVTGRTLTSWPSLRVDIENAGGQWVDREVQICNTGPNTLVTSRNPDDLDAFCSAMVGEFARSTSSVSAPI
jgi:protease I